MIITNNTMVNYLRVLSIFNSPKARDVGNARVIVHGTEGELSTYGICCDELLQGVGRLYFALALAMHV